MPASDLNPEDLRAEDLLDEIHHQRDLSRQGRLAAEKAYQEAEKLRAELSARLERIEDERREVLEQARLDAEAQVRELQDEIREARRALTRARQPLELLQTVEEQAEVLEEAVDRPIERVLPDVAGSKRRSIRLGDKVRLRTINMQGVVTGLAEEEAEVQVGMLRVRTRLADLELASGQSPTTANPPGTVRVSRPATGAGKADVLAASPGIELDLPRPARRGCPGSIGSLSGCGLPGRAALCTDHPRQGHRAVARSCSAGVAPTPARTLLRTRG